MATAGSIDNVQDTAFFVAQYRADESARPDALFHDPLAAKLSGDRGKAIAAAKINRPVTSWLVVVRTVIIDDFILGAIAEGADTVLNLGAGLDARPYRLQLPENLLWIEADFPDMISYKERVLAEAAPRCHLERAAVDLESDASRRAFLAQVAARSKRLLVLTEGVTPYLTNDQVGALADDLHGIGVPALWIVDYVSAQAQEYRRRSGVDAQMRNAPFRFSPGDWFKFFASHGWRIRAIKYLPIEGRKIGRPFPVPRNRGSLQSLIRRIIFRVSRNARMQFAQSIGFALLEPR